MSIDYHIEVEKSYYSVPYQLAGERVDVRATATTAEVLHKGRRGSAILARIRSTAT